MQQQQRILPTHVADFDHGIRSSGNVLLSLDGRLVCHLQDDHTLHAHVLRRNDSHTCSVPILGITDMHTPVHFAALAHDTEEQSTATPGTTPAAIHTLHRGGGLSSSYPSAAQYLVTCSEESVCVHALQLPDDGFHDTLHCRCVVDDVYIPPPCGGCVWNHTIWSLYNPPSLAHHILLHNILLARCVSSCNIQHNMYRAWVLCFPFEKDGHSEYHSTCSRSTCSSTLVGMVVYS